MVIDSIRWSLYPLCFMVFVLPIFNIFWFNKKIIKIYKRFYLLSLITIVISLFFTIIFPIGKMITPNGPFKIGTVTYDATDSNRLEIFTEVPGDLRKIKFKVWYPTDDVTGLIQEPWLEDGKITAEGISEMLHFPKFTLNPLAEVQSHAYQHASISSLQDKYSVVVLSHGWMGFSEIHADTAENLASQGYVVVSIDHTYGSPVTVFKDGSIAYLYRKALPKREKSGFLTDANTLVKTYSDDITFTLDKIENLNNNDPLFKGKLDLTNLGLIGHSTGGGASVRTSLKDNRVKALIGLDAWVEPLTEGEVKTGLTIPSLFFRSEEWEEAENNPYIFTLLQNSDNTSLLQIKGSKHIDFTMAYMFSPISKYINMTGELNGKESAIMQQDFILHFFNKHLNQNNYIETSKLKIKYDTIVSIIYE